MKVTQLIKELERLRNDHFCAMKNIVPMGQVPDEPDVYIDCIVEHEGGQLMFNGVTSDIDVILDTPTGIHIIQK